MKDQDWCTPIQTNAGHCCGGGGAQKAVACVTIIGFLAFFSIAGLPATGSRETVMSDPSPTPENGVEEIVVIGEVVRVGSEPHSKLRVRVHRGETVGGDQIDTEGWLLSLTGSHVETLDAEYQSKTLQLSGILVSPPGPQPGSGVLDVRSFTTVDTD